MRGGNPKDLKDTADEKSYEEAKRNRALNSAMKQQSTMLKKLMPELEYATMKLVREVFAVITIGPFLTEGIVNKFEKVVQCMCGILEVDMKNIDKTSEGWAIDMFGKEWCSSFKNDAAARVTSEKLNAAIKILQNISQDPDAFKIIPEDDKKSINELLGGSLLEKRIAKSTEKEKEKNDDVVKPTKISKAKGGKSKRAARRA
jgi:hypothetical protein